MLTFSLCDQATFTYDLPSIETSEVTLVRDLEIPGNECGNSNKSLPNGVSGAWYDPSRSGEGITFYLFDQDGQQKASIT